MRLQLTTYLEPRFSGRWRNRIFRPPKYRNVSQWKHDTLDPRVSLPLKNHIFMLQKCRAVEWRIKRQGRNRFFRPEKCRKVAQRKQWILQPRVSCPLKNLIFRPPKSQTEALWMLDTLGWMVSWYLSNRIFRSPKYYKGFHGKSCTLELRVSQLDRTSVFRASKSPI
jgi:hypothetical protein